MSVGQVCNRETVIVRPEESIQAAAQLMRSQHVGCVVVVSEDRGATKPVGILTDRDLVLEIIAQGVDADSVSVGDIMSFNLLTAHCGDGLWDTLQRMRAQGARRVPVVDDSGGLVGILSSDDLLNLLADELGMLAKLTQREQQREQAYRPGV